MDTQIWFAGYHKVDGLLEFAVDTIIEPEFLPRIGETIVYNKRNYEVTHVRHDFCMGAGTPPRTRKVRQIKIVGLEKA